MRLVNSISDGVQATSSRTRYKPWLELACAVLPYNQSESEGAQKYSKTHSLWFLRLDNRYKTLQTFMLVKHKFTSVLGDVMHNSVADRRNKAANMIIPYFTVRDNIGVCEPTHSTYVILSCFCVEQVLDQADNCCTPYDLLNLTVDQRWTTLSDDHAYTGKHLWRNSV